MVKGKLEILNDGLHTFYCPGCKMQHGVNIDISNGKPCWDFNGDYEKPTFSPSILVTGIRGDRRCHSFIRDGKIQFLTDCTHELAGKTVELECEE